MRKILYFNLLFNIYSCSTAGNSDIDSQTKNSKSCHWEVGDSFSTFIWSEEIPDGPGKRCPATEGNTYATLGDDGQADRRTEQVHAFVTQDLTDFEVSDCNLVFMQSGATCTCRFKFTSSMQYQVSRDLCNRMGGTWK